MARTSKKMGELFPIWSIENDLVLTKSGSYSAVFEMTMPPIYTLSTEEYNDMHTLMIKAIKMLPDYSIFHKQDIYIEQLYTPKFEGADQSKITGFFEKHFIERPYLNHKCYITLTKSYPIEMRKTSLFTTLCHGVVRNNAMKDDGYKNFVDKVEQIEHVLNESPFFSLKRMRYDDLVSNGTKTGLIERYLYAHFEDSSTIGDIELTDGLKIGQKFFNCLTIDKLDQLPPQVSSSRKYEPYSTEATEFNVSFGSSLGLSLPCSHITNQYIFIEDKKEIVKKMEGKSRNLNSLSFYDRENKFNKEYYDQFLDEIAKNGSRPIRLHVNVFIWDENKDRLKKIKNNVSSAMVNMDIVPRVENINTDLLWWAGIPGNSADFPHESTFHTFIEQAVSFLSFETNQKNSHSPFGIRMVDRLSGIPVFIDLSDEPMKKGIITNRNKFIVGPSGSGKSFFTNHMLRQYYEQNSHVLIIDVGRSYEMLCNVINVNSKGKDGLFITYETEKPLSFNPFYTEDGKYDIEKLESLKTLLIALWKKEHEVIDRSEEISLSLCLNKYIKQIEKTKGAAQEMAPSFNSFYEFVRDVFPDIMKEEKITILEFNIQRFLFNLSPYYKDGEYDFLLNNMMDMDLVNNRFVVFELDNIKNNPILLPVVTIIIMETFVSKMRKLKGIRKVILIEEAWKAIAKEGMAEYIKYLFKTVRKFYGEAIIVTQEISDIIHSAIVKDTIINNSDCKILLDQRKYLKKFDDIANLLGLSEKEKTHILSLNRNLAQDRRYKEVWIGLGGVLSAVYATEVSPQEYPLYTTEESEKLKFVNLLHQSNNDVYKSISDYIDQPQ